MITNLFSIFDPSSSIINMSWIVTAIPLTLTSVNTWNNKSNSNTLLLTIISSLNNEVSFSLNNSENSTEIIIISVILFILLLNSVAIFSQVFSLSSHLLLNLSISLLIWTNIILFSWVNNTNYVVIHLLPQGTPVALIAFIVIIELVSNIIRPITLCVRLTANIVAGHILIELLGSSICYVNTTLMTLSLPLSIILSILETAVAFIQSYVFMTLVTLYVIETN